METFCKELFRRRLSHKLLKATNKLTLVQRVDIAIDVAHALSYLHNDCEIPVVHCDLKPSNVLLDNDMVAHVGDFGLTKFLTQPRHPNQSSSIGILGTIGYVAPGKNTTSLVILGVRYVVFI